MKSCRLLHCVRCRALTGCLWFQHSTNHCPAHFLLSGPALEFKSLHLIITGKLPSSVMRLQKSLPCYQMPPGLWAKKPALSSDCSPHIPGRRRSTWVWTLEAENPLSGLCCRTCCHDGMFHICTIQPSNPNHCWWRSSRHTAGVIEGPHFKFELI